MNTFKRAVLGKLIDLGTAPVQVLEELKDQLQQADWVVKNEQTSGASLYIDVAPPNEEVGNDKGYERLRIQVDNDKIYFVPLLTGLYDVGPIYSIQNNASYSQKVIIDIGGKTYQITTPNADNEAGTRAIFEALEKAGHADYKFSLRMARGSLYVLAEGKNKGAPEVKVTKGYASVNKRGDAYTSGTTVAIPDARRQVTTDLANGFIYFLSVTDRTIGLATRTLTNQYGPIYAAFGDHASALEQTPPACIPVELYCVEIKSDGGINYSWSHCWGGGDIDTGNTLTFPFGRRDANYSTQRGVLDLIYSDDASYSNSAAPEVLIAPLGMRGLPSITAWRATTGYARGAVGHIAIGQGDSASDFSYGDAPSMTLMPILALPDVLAFIGEASDDTLHFMADGQLGQPLSNALAESGGGTIGVKDASVFSAAGGLAIVEGGEVIEYSGVSGNALTGVKRAQQGTKAQAVDAGRLVFPTLWAMKFGKGALFAGHHRPKGIVTEPSSDRPKDKVPPPRGPEVPGLPPRRPGGPMMIGIPTGEAS